MNKIDLTKSQLILEDIKVRVWNDDKSESEVRYLHSIYNKADKPYFCWVDGRPGSHYNYNARFFLAAWKNAELIEPRYKIKEFYDLVEVLKKQGYEQKNNGNFYSKEGLAFQKDMFNYCGKDYDKYSQPYIWRKEWLEEIDV